MNRRLPCLLLIVVCWTHSAAGAAKALRFDFSPPPLEKLLQAAARTRRSLVCRPCAKAPKIDGRLDDVAWRKAAVIKSLYISRPRTRVQLCFDDRALYIAVTCSHAAGAAPKAEMRPRDRGLWSDDMIEIWVDPGRKGKLRYQFAANAAGSIFDQIIRDGAQDDSYDARWQYATARDATAWTVEIALPRAALQLPRWHSPLGFNIGRNGPGMTPRSWAADYGDTSSSEIVLRGMPALVDEPVTRRTRGATGPALAATGGALRLDIERPFARPGDRWIEAALTVSPTRAPLGRCRVRATLYAIGKTTPAAEATATPTRTGGRLSADLRRLGLKQARLAVELFEGEKRTAAVEAFLSARDCEQALRAGQRIPVAVDPPEGVNSVKSWPVAFGVPFAAGSLWRADRLRLVDKRGHPLPAQVEVAGRWAPEGAIQWVLFRALVSPEDGCAVEVGAPATRPDPAAPLRVIEQGDAIIVNTGAARYVLGKGASPIREVRLGRTRVASASGARGLYVVDQRGRLARASADGESMAIEARGPVTACVRFEGFYRTPQGEALARHVTRVEAFAGQPFVNVTHTLILTRDTNEVWFKDIGWELAVEPGTAPSAIFNTSRDEWRRSLKHPLGRGARSVFMLQDSHFLFAHGKNHFSVAALDGKARKTLFEGAECGDWAAVVGARGGLTLSCKDAARQHPKEFEVSADRFVLRLFSNRSGEELDFRVPTLMKKWDLTGWYDHALAKSTRKNQEAAIRKFKTNAVGWAKTHHLRLSPLPARDAAARAARLSRLHSAAVYAHVAPEWVCATRALGRLHPRDTKRFPEAEKVIEATFRVWERRIGEWGDYGFVDYFAGPHLEYRGKYARPYRYCGHTYTLRGDLWFAYARSADRRIRAYTEKTNRAYIDHGFCHWSGDGRVRGLYIMQDFSGSFQYRAKSNLPFYWDGMPRMEVASTTDLNVAIHDYYLTGYRRARDHVLEFGEGLKAFWTPQRAKRCRRGLMAMRTAAQAYAFTWDPKLRAIAEATTDTFEDTEGELLLTKKRAYNSSTYKTQVDIAALLDAWRIFGTPRYYNLSRRVGEYWWQRHLNYWPIFYCSPLGRIGSFLYEETGDPRYAQVLAVKLREASTAYDPKTGKVINSSAGRVGAEDSTFVFQGIPYAEDVLVRAGTDRRPAASWVSCEDFGYPVSIVIHKGATEAAEVTLRTETGGAGAAGGVRVEPVAPKTTVNLSLIKTRQYSNGLVDVRVPKDAPEVDYAIKPGTQGTHFAVADSRRPMVLHAPNYWQPMPAQAPAVRWYFNVPKGSRDAQVFVERPTVLFDPKGKPWNGGKPVKHWVSLPAGQPGLWSFRPTQRQLVRVRNLPPFFAAEDPKSYFTPKIAWEREISPKPTPVSPETLYIPGAIETPGNKAIYLPARRAFGLKAGPPHPSGDGPRFLAFRQGCVEFFLKPNWSTFDFPEERTKSRILLRIFSTGEPWRLTHIRAPKPTNWRQSHVMYAYFMSTSRGERLSMRAYRQTILERDKWRHIAWVWGPERKAVWTKGAKREYLGLRVFVDGKLGRHYAYSREGFLPADLPKSLWIGGEADAAYDELRVSDVRRYTSDFTPPSRDRELQLDKHTRALFHFNGDLKGASYGHTGPLPVELKR